MTTAVDTRTYKMGQTFLKADPKSGLSLHDRIRELPFYNRLFNTKDLSAEELLLHFVNNSAIFKRIEDHLRIHTVYQTVIDPDLFRHEKAEKDIAFFVTRFNLKRPPITKEAANYIRFIDETVQRNPLQLLAITYSIYAGLFLGRAVCNATAEWLSKNVANWSALPEDENGLAYWNFKGLTTFEHRESRKNLLLSKINTYADPQIDITELCDVTKKAVEHLFYSVQSVSPLPSSLAMRITKPRLACLGLVVFVIWRLFAKGVQWLK